MDGKKDGGREEERFIGLNQIKSVQMKSYGFFFFSRAEMQGRGEREVGRIQVLP